MQTKITPDRSYGEKLIALFAKLLFSNNRYSLTELAESLGCSKQTVLRLIDDITFAYDVPLRDEIRAGRKYFWIEQTGGAEPAALLTETEHRTLQMCRSFTEHLLGQQTFQEVERAVEKSGHHLPPGVEPGDQAFGVVRSGVIDYTAHEDVLRTLIASMDRHLVCEVSYQNLTADEPKTFHIKPLKVFAHRESVYVHARRAKSPGKPYKTPKYDPLLAVHRFKSARLTNVPFRRPPHYDFEKVMNQGFGVWNQKKFRVVLELSGWAANFARERIWSPDQKITDLKGDRSMLEFWSTSEPEVLALVLSFGSAAKVVEPALMTDAVTNEVEQIRALYLGK